MIPHQRTKERIAINQRISRRVRVYCRRPRLAISMRARVCSRLPRARRRRTPERGAVTTHAQQNTRLIASTHVDARASINRATMIPAETAWTTIAHFIALCIATSAFFAALGINVYVVVALTDLQNDFMNPHDAARRINRLIWFEILAHCVGTGAMALSGSFLLAIVNVPLIVWHVKGCVKGWSDWRVWRRSRAGSRTRTDARVSLYIPQVARETFIHGCDGDIQCRGWREETTNDEDCFHRVGDARVVVQSHSRGGDDVAHRRRSRGGGENFTRSRAFAHVSHVLNRQP